MKKTYAKPEILFEDFTLSTNIAGDCEKKTNSPSSGKCGVTMTGFGDVFLVGVTGCTGYAIPEDQDGTLFDKACYHVPVSSNTIFNS